MAKEVFGRHEAKYYIDEKRLEAFVEDIEEHLVLDENNQNGNLYHIYNLYADTEDDNIIRNSLSKPKYKEKIRIRNYSEFKEGDMVFLEIKKKCNGFVSKRRTKIKFKDAVNFIEKAQTPKIEPYMNKQVINELSYFIKREPLFLKTQLKYDRMAYYSKEENGLRITFDKNIVAKRNCGHEVTLLSGGASLMEIKAEKAFPLWLVKLLSKHKIYKQSFSKYGKAYEYYLQGKQ